MIDWPHFEEGIAHLSALEDDWDGEGSPPPSGMAVARARALGQCLRAVGMPEPCRVTSSNGGICLEWQQSAVWYLDMEIDAEGRCDCTFFKRRRDAT